MENRILITSDPSNIYGVGSKVKIKDLLEDYFVKCSAGIKNWLCMTPLGSAVQYVADNLGITYQFI